jgi:hypothetical protein
MNSGPNQRIGLENPLVALERTGSRKIDGGRISRLQPGAVLHEQARPHLHDAGKKLRVRNGGANREFVGAQRRSARETWKCSEFSGNQASASSCDQMMSVPSHCR